MRAQPGRATPCRSEIGQARGRHWTENGSRCSVHEPHRNQRRQRPDPQVREGHRREHDGPQDEQRPPPEEVRPCACRELHENACQRRCPHHEADHGRRCAQLARQQREQRCAADGVAAVRGSPSRRDDETPLSRASRWRWFRRPRFPRYVLTNKPNAAAPAISQSSRPSTGSEWQRSRRRWRRSRDRRARGWRAHTPRQRWLRGRGRNTFDERLDERLGSMAPEVGRWQHHEQVDRQEHAERRHRHSPGPPTR